jgi:hypothetical protein
MGYDASIRRRTMAIAAAAVRRKAAEGTVSSVRQRWVKIGDRRTRSSDGGIRLSSSAIASGSSGRRSFFLSIASEETRYFAWSATAKMIGMKASTRSGFGEACHEQSQVQGPFRPMTKTEHFEESPASSLSRCNESRTCRSEHCLVYISCIHPTSKGHLPGVMDVGEIHR